MFFHCSSKQKCLFNFNKKCPSVSNICSGQSCVTSEQWYWIGKYGATSLLFSGDLLAVQDMVSQSNSKMCIYLNKNSNNKLVWMDGLCSTDNFKIICQFEDNGNQIKIYKLMLWR